MTRRIVFLLEQPFTPRNFERYGFPLLMSEGLEPEVWDFTEFLFDRAEDADPVSPDHRHFVRSFPTPREAARAIEAEAPGVFFINLIEPTPRSREIYRALRRARARYAVLTANAIPAIGEVARESAGKKLARLRILIRRPSELLRRVIGKIRWLALHRLSVDPHGATLWVVGGRRSLTGGAPYPRSKQTRNVWAHSLDYDTYLGVAKCDKAMSGQTAVFLDSFLPYHPDFRGEDVPPPESESYFRGLRKLFDVVERRTGLTVVIAAHPRAHYQNNAPFGGRRIVQGRTAELVRDASLVLAHWSTAINYAVLFHKPVMLITSEAFRGRLEARYVEVTAQWLGSQPVDVDTDEASIHWDSVLTVNQGAYRAYREAFIKTEGSPDLPFWQIVADAIRAENEQHEQKAVA